MSRYTVFTTANIFDMPIDEIGYGFDNTFGYFIQGFLSDELVIDRNSRANLSMTGHNKGLGNCEFAEMLVTLKKHDHAGLVFLDLPI